LVHQGLKVRAEKKGIPVHVVPSVRKDLKASSVMKVRRDLRVRRVSRVKKGIWGP
jgi:hypothetical protein